MRCIGYGAAKAGERSLSAETDPSSDALLRCAPPSPTRGEGKKVSALSDGKSRSNLRSDQPLDLGNRVRGQFLRNLGDDARGNLRMKDLAEISQYFRRRDDD